VKAAAAASSDLKTRLDEMYEAFNVADAAEDPVQFLAGYDDPADREVVAFCAASLAFGRVASVKASISRVLDVLGPHPAAFIRGFSPRQHAAPFADFVHRWTRGADIVALFIIMREMLKTSPGGTLESFCARACEIDVRVAYGGKKPPVRAGVRYFFPRPSGGSGCKRLNLFLRWMVRRDEVDPGGWTGVRPAQLVIPLDTHVIRLGRCLRLTTRTSPGWKMAAEITRKLRALDPVDPVRYDFSVCHLGMMNACGFTHPRRDSACPLRGHCHPAVRKPRASLRPSAPR
jgi:uncharacterized protein (TIGR02757 family)